MCKGLKGCLIDNVYAGFGARVSFLGNMFRGETKKGGLQATFLLNKTNTKPIFYS